MAEMEMKFYGIFCLVAVFIAHGTRAATLPPQTTAWPEICRVMSLYRTCDDITFRIACSYLCDSLALSCEARNMKYIPTKGKCYGITRAGENLWPYALNSCQAYSATLATLKDASDADVFAYLNGLEGGTQTKFLVGALSIGKEGTWVNVDGTAVDDAFWSSSKPTSSNNLCMYSEKTKDFKKNSDTCGTNRGFICSD